MSKKYTSVFSLPVIVAALGYFVDIYDLLLFNIVRIPSLRSLGLSPTDVDKKGELIIGIQMVGLLIAGIGLAGELGAGVTLVSELLRKEQRGIGTSLVAGIGLTGAVVAFFISQKFDWRVCYFIGGGLGFLL